ncbi:MAG: HAD-IA family hydrolase, partial [Gammaproteobacteria bacterium]|nr:HAD-IA family hydrolase [Gammaproteobacteria bacterium]
MEQQDWKETPPTTIIFDLDGTLRESVPGGDQFMLEYATSLGVECSPECFIATRQWAHRYWASSEYLMMDQETYGRGETAFWENYARRTLESLGAPAEQVKKLSPLLHAHMAENYRPEDTIPEDVIPTLVKLKDAGLTVGLLTNRTNPADEYLGKVGLADYLDFYISAGQVGVWKPDPEIFYYSLGTARALPQQSVYIGDNYYADIVGARNAGLNPVLIDRERVFPDADCPVIYEIG